MRRSVAGTFALLIAAIVTAGCGPIQSSQATAPSGTPPSGGSTPAIPSSAAATASPSPSASLSQVPAGLPVVPRAEPVDPDPGVIGRWEVAAIGPDVYQFYLDALPAAGFVVTDRYPGGNVAVIRFATPDGTSLDLALVGVGEDSSRTRIDLLPTEGP
jgi:hypothetical protein